MRWNTKDLEVWHDWFAWFPVRVEGGEMVWLETVRRRGQYSPTKAFGPFWVYVTKEKN